MEVDRAVQESRAREAGPVAVERVARPLLDALVAGQAEVVVRAQHHPLGALHVHDRPRRAAQRPPVRDDVGLAGRAQDLRALVIAGLGEDVDGGRHVGCRGHARRGPPRRVQTRAEGVHRGCRGGSIVTSRTGFPRSCWSAQAPGPQAQPVLRARRGRVLPRLARRPPGRPHHRAGRPQPQRVPGQRLGPVRLLRVRGRSRGGAARCSTPPQAWLRERGRDRMVGPMDFTTNDECGLLVEGHERPPIILSPGSTRTTSALLEGAGLDQGDGPASCGSCTWTSASSVHQAIWDMAEKVRVRARDHRAAHAQARPPGRGRALPRGLQRRLGAQLGLRAADRGGGPPLRQGAQAGARRELGDDRRGARRRGRRRGADAPGLQPGARPASTAACCRSAGRRPCAARRKIDRVRVFALGRQARVPAHRGGRRAVQMHFDSAERTPQNGGRDGLDPRDATRR